MNDRAIYVRLQGGLGNQMFQFAAGLALARRHGCPLKLDPRYISSNPARSYALDGFGVRAEIARPAELAAFAADQLWRRRLGKLTGRHDLLLPSGYYLAPHFHFDETFLDHEPPAYLDGYWQSPRYFETVVGEVRAAFAGPADPSRRFEEMRHEIIAAGNAVSIHVRRGDYVTGPAAHKFSGSCTPDYYARAVALMARLVPGATYFVFSDEPDEAGRMLAFADPVVIAGTADRPAEDIALMAACRHHIIANSSFSWWAAWLNPSPRKTVIAPRLWFSPDHLRKTHTFDLYPKDWITLG